MLRSIQQFQKESRPDIVDALDNFMNLAQETTLREILSHLDSFPTTIIQGALFEGVRTGQYACELDSQLFHLDSPTRLLPICT